MLVSLHPSANTRRESHWKQRDAPDKAMYVKQHSRKPIRLLSRQTPGIDLDRRITCNLSRFRIWFFWTWRLSWSQRCRRNKRRCHKTASTPEAINITYNPSALTSHKTSQRLTNWSQLIPRHLVGLVWLLPPRLTSNASREKGLV